MALVRTDYGLIYNTDGSLCATLLPDGGVAVEEGTVNLVSNPTKWAVHSHHPYQESVSTGERFLGCRVTKTTKLSTGSPPTQIGENLSIADGEIYTASVYVKITQKGNLDGARLIFYDGNTSQILAQTSSAKVGEWERLEVTYANNTGSTLDDVRVYYYPSRDVGDITYTAAPQLEQKPFATSFVDGTRAAGRLVYPTSFNMNEGTIHVWFYFNGTTAWNTLRGTVFRTKQGSGGLRNHFWLFTSTESGYNSLQFQVRRDDGSAAITQEIKHFSDISDGWHSAVVRWSTSAQSLNVFLDGQLLTSYTYSIDGLLPFDAIDVGCRDTTDQSNTLIDELLILPYAVSPETIATWHSLDAPFYDPREQIDAGAKPVYAPGVVIDETGAWGIANGVKQAGFGTDGKWVAGGGKVVSDAQGLRTYDKPYTDPTAVKQVEIGTDGALNFGGGAGRADSEGMILYDISDPANPKPMIRFIGKTGSADFEGVVKAKTLVVPVGTNRWG